MRASSNSFSICLLGSQHLLGAEEAAVSKVDKIPALSKEEDTLHK